jgi:putative protease
MSSMLGGRSGNRGRCAQPCRLPYSFKQKTGSVAGYLLSPKDLYSLDSLPELIDAGVDSLKIEGRMKKPEYAALTASLYRKYTDLYLEKGRENYRVQASDKEQLLELYNRGGFTNGYFRQHNGPQMMSVDRPNHSGIMIGTAKMQSKNQLVIENDQALFKGDVLELPDGSSLKLEKDIPSGKKTVQKYIGRPFHGKLPVIRTRNERLIAQITETFVKDSELKEKIYGSVNRSA